jgi:hypothetical protein
MIVWYQQRALSGRRYTPRAFGNTDTTPPLIEEKPGGGVAPVNGRPGPGPVGRPSQVTDTDVASVTHSLFVWLVADADWWFVLREKYCWLVADKPSEHNVS